MKTPWRTILIGAGRMGKNHLRVLEASSDFNLIGIVDPNYHGDHSHWATLDDCLKTSDFEVAIVAAPTGLHFEIVATLLRNGKNVLVEKPLAPTHREAAQLCELARETSTVLRVGHLERLNPAIRKLKDTLTSGLMGEPIHFSFTRVGGYPNQVSETDNVLMDLAVHDIDVLHFLVGASPNLNVVGAVNHSTWRPGVLDTSEILLSRLGSVSASIHVNWVTPTKLRNLRVTCTRGVCFVDYILQTCSVHTAGQFSSKAEMPTDFESLFQLYQKSGPVELEVEREEPLKVQLREFNEALRGRSSQACTDLEATAAVKIAEEALQADFKQRKLKIA